MSRDQLELYKKALMTEISKRRPLGGYSPEAPTILMLCEMMYEIARHLREKMPVPRRSKGDDS